MNKDSGSVVDRILREETALRILEEQRAKKQAAEQEKQPQAQEQSADQAQAEQQPADQAQPEQPAPEQAQAPDEQEPEADQPTMEQAAQMVGLKEGTIVKGTIVQIDEDGVLVDVGAKSEGVISPREFASGELENLEVGQQIDVFVVSADDDEGAIILSKKRADYEINWARILEAYEKGEIIDATVVERVKGGLRVDLGIMGFIPASHVGVRNPRELERFVGSVVRAKIIEVDKNRKKVILSRRIAEKEERERRKREVMASLKEGQVRDGVVRNITNYGAFVDLGGVDGLLHITEMSWVHINHPREVLNVGDQIQVMVLKVDRENDRISLGLKQLLPDPWEEVGRNYEVGQTIRSRVTRCVSSGAFVRLPEGVEAFIPISEMALGRRIEKPEEVVKPGDEVEAKVLSVQPKQRRMTLSLAAVQAEIERSEMESYMNRDSGAVTLGERIGEQLRAAKEAIERAQAQRMAEARQAQAAQEQEQASAPASGEQPDEGEAQASAEAEQAPPQESEQQPGEQPPQGTEEEQASD